jgi:hypothetical protein
MAGKLSPATQVRLAELATLSEKLHRAHNLVEQFATDRINGEQYLIPVARTFGQLKLQFSGVGLDAMSQLAGSMEIAARRGLSTSAKIRVLREGVGSLRFQLEMEQRLLVSNDKAAREKAESEARAADDAAPPAGG